MSDRTWSDPSWPPTPSTPPTSPAPAQSSTGTALTEPRPTNAGSNGAELDERAKALADRQKKRPGKTKTKAHFWTRWLHVYLSMFSFLILLFFGVTGITLNHPDWTFGSEPVIENLAGALPESVVADDGSIEFLLVSEFVRSEHSVRGDITDFGENQGAGTITYRAPAYRADLAFDATTLDYTLAVEQEGFVAAMNSLHQGRDAGSVWRWVIDISGAVLAIVGLSGLAIQLFMRKRRISGISLAVAGAVVAVIFIFFALG